MKLINLITEKIVLKMLIPYLNEGIKIWFFFFKAIFRLIPLRDMLSLPNVKNENQLILQIANYIDFYYQDKPNEFISVF